MKICLPFIFSLIILWSTGFHSYPQEPVQTIRGRVLDKAIQAPLEGASVLLQGADPHSGTVTDSSGRFTITGIKAGRYNLVISYVGYNSQIVPSILLNAGKEKVLEVALERKLNPLEEVMIVAEEQSSNDPAEVNYLSSRRFTVEEAQRYAATFYDPARVITTGPGVVATNDQANHLVIRGNNPNNLLWRIEGADVVNPNHLTNAGTVSDRPSLSGGGVAILSTQVLGTSRFLSGAFQAGYGNTLSGVFDMQLRDGNNRDYEFTIQASLLGIDVAAEGPFSPHSDASFLINYRYSTLGLFEMAGIPIGDETINFQDLSLKVSLPTENLGNFSIFAIGGKSITLFSGARDSSEWIYQKDRTDVDFYSNMGAAGMSHNLKLNSRSGINSALVFSGLGSGRTEAYIRNDYSTAVAEHHELSLVKRSLSTYYFLKLNPSNLIKAGTLINSSTFRIVTEMADSRFRDMMIMHHGNDTYTTFQPYLHWQYQTSTNLTLNMGLHSLYSGFNGSFSAEPRISMKWQMNPASFFTAGYGLHSRMQHPAVYFNSVHENQNLGFTKAHHWIAGYTRWFRQDLVFRSELYYQKLFDVPVLANRPGSFSALNLMETEIIAEELANEGTGKNYGSDLSLEMLMNRGVYFIMAGSLYNSRYTGSDGIERDTRFNGKYMAKFTAGKEFESEKEKGIRTFGINVSTTYAGGFRYTPGAALLQPTAGATHSNDNLAFSGQLDDFFRLDLRLLWRKNKSRYTRTFAIDIQNATNRKNAAWPYYDYYQNKTVFKKQLGILPFISYRIEF